MPISRLYGGAIARFTREIKRSEFWDRAAIDTPPVPFDDGTFVWTRSRESRVEAIDVSSVRRLSLQPAAPVFVFVQRTFRTQ